MIEAQDACSFPFRYTKGPTILDPPLQDLVLLVNVGCKSYNKPKHILSHFCGIEVEQHCYCNCSKSAVIQVPCSCLFGHHVSTDPLILGVSCNLFNHSTWFYSDYYDMQTKHD